MENYYLDWANLLLRWLHVITAIAWIGSSFYFVFLDGSLTPPVADDLKRQGVSGELWAVHGGGFYHPVKFNVAPLQLPRTRQPDRPAADDRGPPRLMLGRELRRHQPGAPGERHPGAAVPVVVHEQLVVESVRPEDEPGITVRTQADRRADDVVP